MVDFAKLVLEVDTSDLEQGEAKSLKLLQFQKGGLMVDFAKLVLELDTSDLEQGEAKLKNLTLDLSR